MEYEKMNEIITREMIEAAMAGDQSALSDLYNRTYNGVYHTARFLVKDEDAVLDILQDTYIKAFDSLDQLKEASKFEAWVKRIAHNKAIDYLRKAKPIAFSGMVAEDSPEVLDFEDDRPDNLPELVIDRKETTRLINEILDSLPDDQRACISLFYYDQLSVKEIAQELGIPEATVKSRLQYGRKKIEIQVRELEKKGTKLYGIAPIPFLMLLFRQEAQAEITPSSAAYQNILRQTAGTRGIAGAKTAGTVKAAGAAAKTALATKVVAVVTAVAVIGGIGAVALHHNRPKGQEQPVAEDSRAPEPKKEEPPAPSSKTDKQEETSTASKADAKPASSKSWSDAYQVILDGYKECLSGGLGGSSPYLAYDKVRFALEAQDGNRDIMYGLHDINSDGTPELILALCENLEDIGDWYSPFEIYSFNGTDAPPLCREIYEDYETLHIGENGIVWIDSGNSGFTDTTFYELSMPENELKQTAFFDPIDGEDYFRYIVDGEEKGRVQLHELWNEYIPEDAEISYKSILEEIPASDSVPAPAPPSENPFSDRIAYVKSQLGIPEDLDTEDVVDFAHPSYWEAGDMWLVNCEFYHNGELVATAMVDRETGELARNIMVYTGN